MYFYTFIIMYDPHKHFLIEIILIYLFGCTMRLVGS